MSPYQSIQNGFDSKIIPFYIRVIFPKNGKIVPGLARAMERTTNLSIILLFH